MTNVHFVPSSSASLDPVPIAYQGGAAHQNNAAQLEIAAFEKGRMQGEMDAIRRMENEAPLKSMALPGAGAPVALVPKADIVEINRLTWLQRGAAVVGEMSIIAALVCLVIFQEEYQGGFGWYDGRSDGNVQMWNTHFLCLFLGLTFLAQAILMYRVLPLNLNADINRMIYTLMQCCVIATCIVSFIGRYWTELDDEVFWSVDSWCFIAALGIVLIHSVYSLLRCWLAPVAYEKWSETENRVTNPTAEQSRDKSAGGAGLSNNLRTLYAPQPAFVPTQAAYVPSANANVGAQVPVAPANAPRWAELPRTYSNDYFLLPRAKWAVLGFLALACSFLMALSAMQHDRAGGHGVWSQQTAPNAAIDGTEDPEVSIERDLIGAMGVLTLAGSLLVAYAAMPPRTTLVKNGNLTPTQAAESRRGSISHNADTVIGGGNIV